MSLSSYLTFLLGLWALTLTNALPAPVRDLRQAVGIEKMLLSHSSGQLVVVDADGNVTADSSVIHQRSYFYHRTGDYHVFESGFLNGSFLHFEFVQTKKGLENGTTNGTSTTNSTSTTNNTRATNDTSTSLDLRVGDITSNQTHLHHWNEEVAGQFYRYYVTIEEGVNCYLAFEADGSPVADPCSDDLDLDKALFTLWVNQETSSA